MLILHANWSDGALSVWAEALEAYVSEPGAVGVEADGGPATAVAAPALAHPFTVPAETVIDALVARSVVTDAGELVPVRKRLRLPSNGQPKPSARLAGLVSAADSIDLPTLQPWSVEAVQVPPDETLAMLLRLEDLGPDESIDLGHDLRFWIAVARFVIELLADQRFLPTLMQARGDDLRAAWLPWVHDEAGRERLGELLEAMPPACRAVDDGTDDPWTILDTALRVLTDATVRRALIADAFDEAIDGRDPGVDPHVAWLSGLLAREDDVNVGGHGGPELLRDVGRWVGRLEETGRGRALRLGFEVREPEDVDEISELRVVPDSTTWRLALHLRSDDDPPVVLDAEQVWQQAAGAVRIGGALENPQEFLLAELGRAARIYTRIEDALGDMAPTGLDLTTEEAYAFLREFRPLLEESGFEVVVPDWWDEPTSRLGARLRVESPELDATSSSTSAGSSVVGLGSMVRFSWQIAIGDEPLSIAEFEQLAKQTAPLLRVRGRWVEVRPDEIARAMKFMSEEPTGEMTVLEAFRIAHGGDKKQLGLPVFGLDASGWVADLLGAGDGAHALEEVEQPPEFKGKLRPYQKRGLSWLVFLDKLGLGGCLADDMGLGKTIQLIALLQHERRHATARIAPTLLVVPTSLVANWTRELARFAEKLAVHVQHGPDRPVGEQFAEVANRSDVVITTYGLVARDFDTLNRVGWWRVVLDEAQYIKNPPTKQTTAIRGLRTTRRIAVTGTPVENRLSELWSIMEFCNPGYLGASGEFRRRFAVPIERHRDRQQAKRLRSLIQPFVLRRLKTDPTVIDDLPACVETKEYATLTAEQASLYENIVGDMMKQVDRAEGIQRRGLVLSTLVKLKQACNHPAQLLKEGTDGPSKGAPAPLTARSGKSKRLIQMLEEVVATDAKALVFTQFRQMGHLLSSMIRHELDCDTLFLHGGTPQGKRQEMIDRFQDPNGGVPVFVLSLKAGGVGLNLTAANHVFHFDRWWNPAVESQATDRAFRIGQTRTVHVHKFVCVGTLEERIDQMIEQKTELAQNIVGSGEQWLTELSSGQLRDLLTLRDTAMEGEG